MNNTATAALQIEKTTDGRWAVHTGEKTVIVQTNAEAVTLSSLPIEHSNRVTGSADAKRFRRVVEVAKRYGYTSIALRGLEAWLRQQDED